ncbi:MAG: glycosyl transferase family 1 [Acidobacteria bacterium]|nr:glycosyl transferase family 1 [Acidobacteriota bacterium]
MTHFARPAALAQALDPAEWDVYFWTPKRLHPFFSGSVARLGDLATIDPTAFLNSLAQGTVSYSKEALHKYVRDDLAIFEAIQPDLVIGDYRLSLCISAPVARLRFASIFNAQWSPYRKQPAIIPELPITRWLSPRLLNRVYAGLRPIFYAVHAKPVNDTRRAFGLPRLSRDLRDVYTAGDLVLYPDVPEFVPVAEAPSHHHFIGPCAWSAAARKPDWWGEVMSSSNPRVFVSLGSSGPIKALPAVLEALSQLPVTVILATSGRIVGPTHPSVYVWNLLPYEETASHVAAVVSHGGTGAVYPALSAGTPILAIPSNIDMHLSSALLEESGAGLQLRVEHASPERLRNRLGRLLSEGRFKDSAGTWRTTLAHYDTKVLFPNLLRQWFASQRLISFPRVGA